MHPQVYKGTYMGETVAVKRMNFDEATGDSKELVSKFQEFRHEVLLMRYAYVIFKERKTPFPVSQVVNVTYMFFPLFIVFFLAKEKQKK